MIKLSATQHITKILSLIVGGLLLTQSFAVYAGDVGICGPDQRCLLIGKFKPGLLPNDGANGAGNDHMIVFEGGQWKYEDTVLATFGMGSWQPILGDWDGDGYDEPGVYSNGLFVLKHRWEGVFGPLSPVYFGSTDATPLIGDWNGDGVDSIGTYRSGKFELVIDYNIPVSDHVIEFGVIPQDTDAVPVVGPFGQSEDVVGLLVDGSIQYSPSNSTASYDFFTFNDPGLVKGTVLINSIYKNAHPTLVDADALRVPGRTGKILGLIFPPGLEPLTGFICAIPTNCYFYNPVHGQPANSATAPPDTEGGVIIPGNPFSDN